MLFRSNNILLVYDKGDYNLQARFILDIEDCLAYQVYGITNYYRIIGIQWLIALTYKYKL